MPSPVKRQKGSQDRTSTTHLKPQQAGSKVPLERRLAALEKMLGWMQPVPDDWITPIDPTAGAAGGAEPIKVSSLPCDNYSSLIGYWERALKWRQDLDDVLSVVLAVALSTVQQGDQLFLMMLGDAGTGKTRICDAMLVSDHCYPLEHLTGFFSGFKGPDGKDCSLISRVNGKLMITPEGDVLMSNPKFVEIMAQQRRIFDGVSGASYKNRDEDLRYSGLRTPWIIAGTPALLDTDQSRLGDRFLKVFVETPTESQRQDILSRVSRAAFKAVQEQASGDNHVGEKMAEAYARTGGYVDWLRENNGLLSEVLAEDRFLDYCEQMGDFVSYLRARPSKSDDGAPTREQPTRLTSQFVRLMACLTVVLNRQEVDQEVMRRVRRVALNTAHGIGQSIAKVLYEEDNKYLPNKSFHTRLDFTPATIDRQLRLMRQVGALQLSTDDPSYVQKTAKMFWKLTPRMRELFKLVYEPGKMK